MILTHGSLFSGIGGFELGADWAGLTTLWNCEINADNRKVLADKFPSAHQFHDIKKLNYPPLVDIISGGFPCQDISIAKSNYDGINGKESRLWFEYLRIIGQSRPKYAILENSPIILTRGLHTIIAGLASVGYCLEWQCLSATQFGFDHIRKRFYGVAYPMQERRQIHPVFRKPETVHAKRNPSRENLVPLSIKRFKSHEVHAIESIHDGFYAGLDERIIEGAGNAIIPHIANYIFECIKLHDHV